MCHYHCAKGFAETLKRIVVCGIQLLSLICSYQFYLCLCKVYCYGAVLSINSLRWLYRLEWVRWVLTAAMDTDDEAFISQSSSEEETTAHSDNNNELSPLISSVKANSDSNTTCCHIPVSPWPVYIVSILFFLPASINDINLNSLLYNKLCYQKYQDLELCSNKTFTQSHPDLQVFMIQTLNKQAFSTVYQCLQTWQSSIHANYFRFLWYYEELYRWICSWKRVLFNVWTLYIPAKKFLD